LNTTTRISVASDGTQATEGSMAPSISADGRYVAFSSAAGNLVGGDTNGVTDDFLHDMQTGATTRLSVDSSGTQANNYSWASSISGDGRYVASFPMPATWSAGITMALKMSSCAICNLVPPRASLWLQTGHRRTMIL